MILKETYQLMSSADDFISFVKEILDTQEWKEIEFIYALKYSRVIRNYTVNRIKDLENGLMCISKTSGKFLINIISKDDNNYFYNLKNFGYIFYKGKPNEELLRLFPDSRSMAEAIGKLISLVKINSNFKSSKALLNYLLNSKKWGEQLKTLDCDYFIVCINEYDSDNNPVSFDIEKIVYKSQLIYDVEYSDYLLDGLDDTKWMEEFDKISKYIDNKNLIILEYLEDLDYRTIKRLTVDYPEVICNLLIYGMHGNTTIEMNANLLLCSECCTQIEKEYADVITDTYVICKKCITEFLEY